MQTVFETRHQRLTMLVNQYGSIADLNRAIGRESNWARLYQIYNRSIRSDRGTPFVMGDDTAREIEQKLSLQEGWMDTPPSYNEIHGREDPKSKAMLLLEQMSPEQALVATRLLTAIAEPEKKQGNGG